MNKRIQELAEQALTYIEPVPGHSGEGWIFDKEKFAELIVQECAALCETTAAGRDAEAIAEAILAHFGVGE